MNTYWIPFMFLDTLYIVCHDKVLIIFYCSNYNFTDDELGPREYN